MGRHATGLSPEYDALVDVTRGCLEAGGGGHELAMFHVNVASLDDPSAAVDGYRGGSIISLDVAARERGVPFACRSPRVHDAVLATLDAYAESEAPLYLLRIRFARGAAGWGVLRATMQPIAERIQLVEDRRELDEKLRAALVSSVDREWSKVRLQWNSLPGQVIPLSEGIFREDLAYEAIALPAAVAGVTAEFKAFYEARGFSLDAITASVERSDDTALKLDDYYG